MGEVEFLPKRIPVSRPGELAIPGNSIQPSLSSASLPERWLYHHTPRSCGGRAPRLAQRFLWLASILLFQRRLYLGVAQHVLPRYSLEGLSSSSLVAPRFLQCANA